MILIIFLTFLYLYFIPLASEMQILLKQLHDVRGRPLWKYAHTRNVKRGKS